MKSLNSLTIFFSIIIILILWVSTIVLVDYQGKKAQEKLKIVVGKIDDYEQENGEFPNSLDFILEEYRHTYIYILKRKMNIYIIQDSTYKVGWEYDPHRVYYDGKEKSYLYLNNMIARF